VGKDRAYSSYDNYRKRRNRLASFLEYEYHVKDIAFRQSSPVPRKALRTFSAVTYESRSQRRWYCLPMDDPFDHQEAEVDDLYGL